MNIFNGKIAVDKDGETNSITSGSTAILNNPKATSNNAMVVQSKAIKQNPVNRLAGINQGEPKVGFK
jgi:predicted pyridoxine 5'-phosphate oxidase superfamily flavin-nucleotide-binding protein